MPNASRTAQAVIDQAITENRGSEMLLYSLCGLVCGCGLFALCWGTLHNQPLIALAGGVPSSILWPALGFAAKVRKQNLAIRLLEVPMTLAVTEKGAAEMLRDVFAKIFLEHGGSEPATKVKGLQTRPGAKDA